MADFKFSCAQCGQHIACDAGYSGMQINCPTCQQLIVVPQAPRPAAAPPTPPSAPSRLATQRSTATPAPVSTPGRAPFTPPVVQKKSSALKTVLVITAVIVVLAVLGGGGWIFYS